jgi:hypothetical protein
MLHPPCSLSTQKAKSATLHYILHSCGETGGAAVSPWHHDYPSDIVIAMPVRALP